MTSAIRNTIVAALPFGAEDDYSGYISNVELALVERDWAITDQLKAIALRETEFNEEQLDELFGQVGLQVRPKPEPVIEVEPAVEQDPEAPVTRTEFSELINIVSKLGEELSGLAQLAQKHLGTSAP